MTRREAFEAVRYHLLVQRKRSGTLHPGDEAMDFECMYRFEDLKCAAGCLISDEHYSPSLERKGANHTDVVRALEASGVPTDYASRELIEDLQRIHDTVDPADWAQSLSDIESIHFPNQETR